MYVYNKGIKNLSRERLMACYPLALSAVREFSLFGFPPDAIPPNHRQRSSSLRWTPAADHRLAVDTQSSPSSAHSPWLPSYSLRRTKGGGREKGYIMEKGEYFFHIVGWLFYFACSLFLKPLITTNVPTNTVCTVCWQNKECVVHI